MVSEPGVSSDQLTQPLGVLRWPAQPRWSSAGATSGFQLMCTEIWRSPLITVGGSPTAKSVVTHIETFEPSVDSV